MIQTKFPCTTAELYTIAFMILTSAEQILSRFTSFKAKYVQTWFDDARASVQAAVDMPGDMMRTAMAKDLHITMGEKARACCNLFMRLKRYINDAWPPSHQQTFIDAAGQQYYAAASRNNWDSVELLMDAAIAFVAQYQTQLALNDNMPANFGTLILTNAKLDFFTVHQSFLQEEENATMLAEQKNTANNNVYDMTINLGLDGQEISRDEEALRQQFTFEHCLFLVRGAGTAGVRGSVKNSTTNQPIADATITVGFDKYSTTSDIDGHYEISPAAAGTYSVTVTATGFQPFTIPAHVILTGTISTLNILLVPVVEP